MSVRRSAVVAAVVVLSACAPDSLDNYKATGFNGYLNTVQSQCQPLWIGGQSLQQIDSQYAGAWQSGFNSFLDMTSQLYYNRMTPAGYRVAVQSLAMTTSDSRTNNSIDCIVAKLPSNRPNKP